MITDVQVYGLHESINASGFPMRTDDVSLAATNGRLDEGIKRSASLASATAGSGHDCFLKGIVVQGTLKYSQALTKQVQRYHWFEYVSSTSMMHKILKMNIADSCRPEVLPEVIAIVEGLIREYNEIPEEDKVNKRAKFNQVVYNCPMGFQLSVRFSTNYLQLKTIYAQRKNHKLLEWDEIISWIESLPMSHFITRKSNEK